MKKTMLFLSILLIFSFKSIALDLSIGKSTVSPTTVSAGTMFSVTSTVSNPGGGNPGGTWVNYYLSTNNTLGFGDVLLGSSISFSTYPQTLTTNISTLCNVTAGTYYVICKVDPQNNISEIDELNNISVAQIVITVGPPNLKISLPNANPTIVRANSTINVSCNVNNTGNTSSVSDLKIYLSDNTTWDTGDALLSTVSIGSLNPMASQAVSQSVNIAGSGSMPQTKFIIFKSDANNVISECNENDNIGYKEILITNPDLIIQNASVTPISTQNASSVTISGLITNTGAVNAPVSLLKAYLSDDCVLDVNDISLYSQNYSIPEIPAGTSYNINNLVVYIPSNTSCTFPQSKYIILVADANYNVQELNENNNTTCLPISIESSTVNDLSISRVGIGFDNAATHYNKYFQFGETPTSITSGAPSQYYAGGVLLDASVKNNSCNTVYDVKVRRIVYYLGNSTPESTEDIIIPSIPGNEEQYFSTSYGISGASMWGCSVYYTIDPDNLIVESMEYNNHVCICYNSWCNGKSSDIDNMRDKEDASIIIYPNPAYDYIRINNAENSNIAIYDVLGKVVLTEANITNDYNLNVSNLAKGNYVVKIMNGTQVVTKKITIIK